jgi:hypothetical protein
MLPFLSKPGTRGGASLWLVASLALAVFLTAAPVASADPVQFAAFQNTTGNPFAFTNNINSATMSASTQVTFNFTAATGLDTSDRAATLTLTGATNMSASSAGSILDQPINGPATLNITENSTGRLLLQMDFTGDLVGQNNSPNANLLGFSDNGNLVLFSSSYLNSFGATGNSYDLSMPTVTPLLSLEPFGFMRSFTSNIDGSFVASITAVPQPTSVVMFGTGLAATAALARRVRRKRLAGVARA